MYLTFCPRTSLVYITEKAKRMNDYRKDINDILRDALLGEELSEEESRRLETWLGNSPGHRLQYNRLLNRTDFAGRYECYDGVDGEAGWQHFRKSHFAPRHVGWKRVVRYAAMLLLPVAGVVVIWWMWNSTPLQVEVPQEIRQSMERSVQMGKQKATLRLADGERISLDSAVVIPVQKMGKKAEAGRLHPFKPGKEDIQEADKALREPLVADGNSLFTQSDSEYWITFEDGTIVHLNNSTTLRFPTHFSAKHRTVYLHGEAYFLVAKEHDRPFRVVTDAGVVTQYGTSFNVNTYSKGQTKVVLVSGSIGVTSLAGIERRMKPGQMALLTTSRDKVELKDVNVDSYIAWNTGRFVFNDCPLDSLMDVVGLWYGKQVVFESDELRHVTFSGDIDRYNSINAVLEPIRKVTGMHITADEKRIVLKKK